MAKCWCRQPASQGGASRGGILSGWTRSRRRPTARSGAMRCCGRAQGRASTPPWPETTFTGTIFQKGPDSPLCQLTCIVL